MRRGIIASAHLDRWAAPCLLRWPCSDTAVHATASFATAAKSAIPADLEVVVGVELHVQINSATKLFSRAPAQANLPPNTAVSVFDAALPGTLPAINRACVEAAVRTGLSVGGTVQQRSLFERKHYFYPDLPHGYQITQNAHPIVTSGSLTLPATKVHPARLVRIKQIQLEMDTGKSSHEGVEGARIDLNRAGSALMEIVSEPDLRSGEEAAAFVRVMQHRLRHIGTSDGNMEDGSLRADVNVSVRSRDGTRQSARCELKNLNSIRSVSRAVDVEAKRHAALLLAAGTNARTTRADTNAGITASGQSGGNGGTERAEPLCEGAREALGRGGQVSCDEGQALRKETRAYDPVTNTTSLLRSKEDALDYRFLPEPDLPPLVITDDELAVLAASVPEPPECTIVRLCQNYAISPALASQLVAERPLLVYFERVMEALACQMVPTPGLQGATGAAKATQELASGSVDMNLERASKTGVCSTAMGQGQQGVAGPAEEKRMGALSTIKPGKELASGTGQGKNLASGTGQGQGKEMQGGVLPPPARMPLETLREEVTVGEVRGQTFAGADGSMSSSDQATPCDPFSMSVAKWVVRDVAGAAKAAGGLFLEHPAVAPARAAQLLRMVATGTLSERMAKEVWSAMAAHCEELPADVTDSEELTKEGKSHRKLPLEGTKKKLPSVERIVEELFKEGGQVTDQGKIEVLCQEIIAKNPKEVAAVRAGKTRILGFFVGQLMKQMGGRADPQKASELFSRLIAETDKDKD